MDEFNMESRKTLSQKEEEQLKGELILKEFEERTKKEKNTEKWVVRSVGLIALIISIIFLAVNYVGK